MAESRALSQWEIDALLNQIPEGGEEESSLAAPQPISQERAFARVIKAYDFRRPDKFSKEQWHTLQSMHDTFARLIGAAFSSRLRTLVSVRLSSIDQGLYEEWQSQVPSQTVCLVLAMSPLEGNIVLEFNNEVASEVIDRMLGGNGLLIDRGRELGEIELTLLRTFSGTVTGALEEMWSGVTPVLLELKDIGLDAGLIQVAGPNDVVVTAFFEVNIGSHLGAMSICIPYTVLEPVTQQLSAQVWHLSGTQGRRDPRSRKVMHALIRQAPVETIVELGGADVALRSIIGMQEGDTLVLDQRVDRPLALNIGGRARFWCRPGLVGKQVGARILDVVEQRDDGLEDEDLLAAGIGSSRLTLLADRSRGGHEPLPVSELSDYQEASGG